MFWKPWNLSLAKKWLVHDWTKLDPTNRLKGFECYLVTRATYNIWSTDWMLVTTRATYNTWVLPLEKRLKVKTICVSRCSLHKAYFNWIAAVWLVTFILVILVCFSIDVYIIFSCTSHVRYPLMRSKRRTVLQEIRSMLARSLSFHEHIRSLLSYKLVWRKVGQSNAVAFASLTSFVVSRNVGNQMQSLLSALHPLFRLFHYLKLRSKFVLDSFKSNIFSSRSTHNLFRHKQEAYDKRAAKKLKFQATQDLMVYSNYKIFRGKSRNVSFEKQINIICSKP